VIPPQMKNNANLVREFIDDVLNQGNVEATGKYFHEDVLEQAPFPGQGPGLSGLKDARPSRVVSGHALVGPKADRAR
jgi:hypothetical protein